MNQCLKLLCLANLWWAISAGCGKPKQDTPHDPEVLATIGDRVISKDAFLTRHDRRLQRLDEPMLRELLNTMIRDQALVARAEKAGWLDDPEVADAVTKAIVGKLLEKELQPLLDNAAPSESAIEQYYTAHQESYRSPERRRGAILYKAMSGVTKADHKASLRETMATIRQEALAQSAENLSIRGFGALAAKHSNDQATRYQGGEIGWLTEGKGHSRYGPEVVQALFELTPDAPLSEVIESPTGFYLVMLLETQTSTITPLEKVKSTIHQQLHAENERKIRQTFFETARDAVDWQIHEPAVQALMTELDVPATDENASNETPPALP